MISEGRSQKLGIISTIYCLLCVFVLLLPVAGNAEELIEVHNLRHWSTSEYVRVVVDLTSPAEFIKGRLSNPERLFIDIKNTKLKEGLQANYPITDRLLKTIRLGQRSPDIVRVVFDLKRDNYDFKVFSFEDPARLIVDIFQRGIDGKKIDTEIGTQIETQIEKPLIRKRIVVDAGHGGHDPGAVGFSGLYEKDVVLDIAFKVRDIIKEEHPLYEVIFTRDRDVFIPLEKRAEIANRNNADLFVSVHTNAHYNRLVRGIETFILNWTDNVESMKVAARENAVSLKKMKQIQSELGIILASLQRENKRDESIKLAGHIQNSMASLIKPKYQAVHNRGVKQAIFFVLLDTKMPSVLVEVGFISNPDEERLLSNEAYRKNIARSIVSGIHAYFSDAPQQKAALYRGASHSGG